MLRAAWDSKYFPFIILAIIALTIFGRWFLTTGILSNGDWGYYHQALQRQFVQSRMSWIGNTALGQPNLTLPYTPLNILENVLGNLGLKFATTERLLYFWPMVCSLFLGGYYLSFYIFNSKIAATVRGRCMDNIFTERLWRTVKYENVFLQSYQDVTDARRGLTQYFDFYNNRRCHQSLDYKTPAAVYFGT
jgi:hypothetical protein